MADHERQQLGRKEIQQILPHGESFMFLESAEVVVPGQEGVGELVDLSGPVFSHITEAHFPGNAIVPGVIMAEALAQLAGVVIVLGDEEMGDKMGVLAAHDLKYKEVVLPGEPVQLRIIIDWHRKVTIEGHTTDVFGCWAEALREGKVAVKGEIKVALIDKAAATTGQ